MRDEHKCFYIDFSSDQDFVKVCDAVNRIFILPSEIGDKIKSIEDCDQTMYLCS